MLVRPLLILASTKILNTFLNIRPLVEPLVTPQTIKIRPIRELIELCVRKVIKKEISFCIRQRLDICRHSNYVGLYQMSQTSVRILED